MTSFLYGPWMPRLPSAIQPSDLYMKTLCLGGSFNPIHHGHLICAQAVAEKAGFERVLLIPSFHPPHQTNQDLASASDRLKMCRLAIKNAENAPPQSGVRFEVSDIELHRSGPSYTIDTVRELKKMGWPSVHWLIGADMLNYLPNWHLSAALLNEVHFVIVARPGVPIDWDKLPESFAELKNSVVQAPLIDISSSEIRNRVRAGKSIENLTPQPVIDYIAKHGLYRT